MSATYVCSPKSSVLRCLRKWTTTETSERTLPKTSRSPCGPNPGWYFEYEPWAVDLGDGDRYLADFHLPAQNVWCEVKGGHNERLDKTRKFRRAVADPDEPGGELVVLLRAAGGPGR